MAESQSQTGRQAQRTETQSFVERNREYLFTGTLLVSSVLFSVGLAFLILAVAVDTNPPSPYLASQMDRLLLFGFSLGTISLGILLGRASFRFGGW